MLIDSKESRIPSLVCRFSQFGIPTVSAPSNLVFEGLWHFSYLAACYEFASTSSSCGLFSAKSQLSRSVRAKSSRGQIRQFFCQAEQYPDTLANPYDFVVDDSRKIVRFDQQSAQVSCFETS